MAFIKKPVTGMRDILPEETSLRVRLTGIIRETYAKYGFTEIETPLVEHIENLTGSKGGENEKLIFRILKRGENLLRSLDRLNAESSPGEYTDIGLLTEEGLRYDLTVPLSRFYAANESKLPQPFKALQIGPVFRADRPQKGRYRQFTQCDIDILGDGSNLSEKELILATAEALYRIGFDRYDFYIVINDRRLLFELIKYAGFPEEDSGKILIILDKEDKIGANGVDDELRKEAYPEEAVIKLREILSSDGKGASGPREFASRIGTETALEAGENVADITETVSGTIGAMGGFGRNFKIVFDPTLVRGMGYYTGTIFEIKTAALGSSVGGGGRYDGMVGKYLGREVPAVGFSIGFERVMTILMEDKWSGGTAEGEKSAWLIEKGMPAGRVRSIFEEAAAEREKGHEILMVWAAKNKKFQKESLSRQGYTAYREFYTDEIRHKERG